MCDTFFDLTKANQIPPWAIAIAPIEELRKGKSPEGKPTVIPPLRAYRSAGCFLILPQRQSNQAQWRAALTLVEEGIEFEVGTCLTFVDIDEDSDRAGSPRESTVRTDVSLQLSPMTRLQPGWALDLDFQVQS